MTLTPYEAGTATGKALLDPGAAMRAAIASSVQAVQQEHAAIVIVRRAAEIKLTQSRANLNEIEQRCAAVRDRAERIDTSRDSTPGRYSWKRGMVYLLAGIAVLFADAVFLTTVLTSVLGLAPTVVGPGGSAYGPFAVVLTGDILKARPFFEVYVAGIGLAALAFAFKAWLDQFARSEGKGGTFGWRGLASPGGVVLLVVGITFIAVAGSRLVVDFGRVGDPAVVSTGEAFVIRLVAMFIGLASPAGGAFLLMKGIDAIAGSALHRQYLAAHVKAEKRREDASRECASAEAAFEDADAKFEADSHALRTATARARAIDEFRRGYADGIAATLHPADGGMYRQVRERLAAAGPAVRAPAPVALLPGDV